MKLFFDTETTGMCDFNQPLIHPSHAHMVSIAAILTDDKCVELSSFYFIACPTDRESHPKALEKHGITQLMQTEAGIQHETILRCFNDLCETANTLIAFNFQYDYTVLTNEFYRFGMESFFKQRENLCEMKTMTNICKIPSPYRLGSYKWPSLDEAHKHCYKESFKDAHNALADVRATIAVHKWLINQ